MSFFSTTPPTTDIYTLSLHDALPIFNVLESAPDTIVNTGVTGGGGELNLGNDTDDDTVAITSSGDVAIVKDRKSTRLNSSHLGISYAVFCLKKKKKRNNIICITKMNT